MKKRLTALAAIVLTIIAALLLTQAEGPAAPEAEHTPPDLKIQSQIVAVGGASVHCLVAGPTQGRPVVLLHGARFSAETWQKTRTIETLAKAACRVYAIDLPGFGMSGLASVQTETFVAEFVAAIGRKPIVLVAPSMSGRYALPFAIQHPESLAGFVPIAPAGIARYQSQLERIIAPTLIVWGDRDTVVPLELAEVLDARIPNSRKLLVKDGPHPCYLHATDAFNDALVAFVQSLPAATSRPTSRPAPRRLE